MIIFKNLFFPQAQAQPQKIRHRPLGQASRSQIQKFRIQHLHQRLQTNDKRP